MRLPGKDTDLLGIDREAERLATKKAAELGLGPKVGAMLDHPACLVTCFVESREVTAAELREPARIEEVARALRGFHESGLELPTDFYVSQIADEYAEVSRSRGGTLPEAFEDARDSARKVVKAVRKNAEHQPVPSHNDLLTANFLHDGERLVIVDWEYAGMGDRFFDLGNFAVNNELGDEDGGAPAGGLLRRAGHASPAGRAEAVPLHVGLPRGDVGRGADERVRAGLRLRRLRRQALQAHGGDERGRALPRLAQGGRWPLSVSSRTPPAA